MDGPPPEDVVGIHDGDPHEHDRQQLRPHLALAPLPVPFEKLLAIAGRNAISASEKNLSLTELYSADEAFTTGTMGELTPILQADGRVIGAGAIGPVTRRLQTLHRETAWEFGTVLPF